MDQPVELRYLLRCCEILARQRYLILIVTILMGLLGAAYSLLVLKPYYKADTMLLIPSEEYPNPLSTLLGATGISVPGMAAQKTRGDVLAILKSRSIAATVVRDLGLQKEYGVPKERNAVDIVQKSVLIEFGKEGQITLTASARWPRLAADIANAYVRALQESRQMDEVSTARRHLRFIETQLLRTKGELRKAEEDLRTFQQHSQLVSIDSNTEETVKRLSQVENDLSATRIGLRESMERIRALRPRLAERARSEGAPALANTEEVAKLRGKLADQESELAVALSGYTAQHPQVIALQTSITALKAQLRQLMAKSVTAVDKGVVPELIDLEVAAVAGEARETALSTELNRLKGKAQKLPGTTLEYARLSREVKVKDGIYQMLLQEFYKAKIAAQQAAPSIQVIDPAQPPLYKSGPKVKRNILMALIAGMMAGIALAFLTDSIAVYRRFAARNQKAELERGERRPQRELETTRRE